MDAEQQQSYGSSFGGFVGLIIMIIIGVWVYNHWFHKPTWTATYYPDAGNLTQSISEQVGSLQECRDWVDAQAQPTGNTGYDYECGTNCKLQPNSPGVTGDFYRCDNTTR